MNFLKLFFAGSYGSQSRSRSSFRTSSVANRFPLSSNKPEFYSRVSPSPPKIYSHNNFAPLLPSRPFHVSDTPQSYGFRDPSFLASKYSQSSLKYRTTESLLNKYSAAAGYSGIEMGSSAGKQIPRISPAGVTSGSAGSHSSYSSASSDSHPRSGAVVKDQLVPNGTPNLRPRSGSRSRQSNTYDAKTNPNAGRALPDLPNAPYSKANTLPPNSTASHLREKLSPSPPTRQANGNTANGTLSVSSSSATVASGTPFSVSTHSRNSSTSSHSSGPQGNGTNGASNHSGPSNSSGFSSSTAGSKANGTANGKPPSGAPATWKLRVGSEAPEIEARNRDASVDREDRSSASPSNKASTSQHPGLNGTSTSEPKATRPEFTQQLSNGSIRAIDDEDSPYPHRRVQSPSPSPAHTPNNAKDTLGYARDASPDVRVARQTNGTRRTSPHSRESRERIEDRALPSNQLDEDEEDEDTSHEQVQDIYKQRSREMSPFCFLKV